MKMGQECNADVLLVHSPAAEKEFMANNYGSDRRLVMHNDFIIVGPASDPAGIKGSCYFSGSIHQDCRCSSHHSSAGLINQAPTTKELAIWKSANITPEGDWYIETGQGMGATLTIASETVCVYLD